MTWHCSLELNDETQMHELRLLDSFGAHQKWRRPKKGVEFKFTDVPEGEHIPVALATRVNGTWISQDMQEFLQAVTDVAYEYHITPSKTHNKETA